MGATTFAQYGYGKTAQDAFRQAVEEAQYYHGHGGYTGTIAEKHSFVLARIPADVRCTPDKFERLIDEYAEFDEIGYLEYELQHAQNATQRRRVEGQLRKARRRFESWKKKINPALFAEIKRIYPAYDDKWGPAVALEVTGAAATKMKAQLGLKKTHNKVFLFCGWASM